MHRAFLIIFVCLIYSCSPKVSSNSTTPLINPQVFASKLYEQFSVIRNNGGDFAIIKNNSTSNKIESSFEFHVFDISANKSIYKDYVTMGTVKWIDQDQILVEWIPGEIEDENYNSSYTYNVKNQIKKFK